MAQKIRCFIAVELNRVVKEKLEKIKNMLRDCTLEINWIDKLNFHITLKFLGDIEGEDINLIKNQLEGLPDAFEPFKININGLGAFPNQDYPKVIWAGVEEGSNQLLELHSYIENKMVDLGYKPEQHNYTPHITLGRIARHEKNFELISKKIKEFPFEINTSQRVKSISIIKSQLAPKGPVYTTLERIKLEK